MRLHEKQQRRTSVQFQTSRTSPFSFNRLSAPRRLLFPFFHLRADIPHSAQVRADQALRAVRPVKFSQRSTITSQYTGSSSISLARSPSISAAISTIQSGQLKRLLALRARNSPFSQNWALLRGSPSSRNTPYRGRISVVVLEIGAAVFGHPVENADANLGFCSPIFEGARL